MQIYNFKGFDIGTSQKNPNTNYNNYDIDSNKNVVSEKGGKIRVKPC